MDQLKGSQSYGREEWYEREASLAQRLRKAVWKENSGKKGGKWQKNLRTKFEHFDRDGDGVVSEKDFGRAIKALCLTVSRAELDRLMEILEQGGNGMISYEDFVDFMVSSDGGDDYDRSDYEDDASYHGRDRKRGKGRSDFGDVVGDYDERLSPRGDR